MLTFANDAIELLGEADEGALAGDKMRFYAVVRAVELVGEAAAQLSREQQAQFPHIPWGPAIATRHRLIHGYGGVNAASLVLTVRQSLPALIEQLEKIVGAADSGG
ncbi:MAG TPA: HepT-like ribonuclease domain-containing protein [Caulobacterales bacterium]|nr:HepT-like ribonuclease domain-containing protein [Caulobacterales bacterium]